MGPRRDFWAACVRQSLVAVALVGCDSGGDGGSTEGAGRSSGEAETCPVAELVAEVASVEGLVADATGAFWMDGGTVFRVEDVDRATRIVGEVGSRGSTVTGNRLTASEAHLYASGSSGIFRMSKDGTTAPEVLTAPLDRVHALAVTSEWLFIGRMNWVSDPGSLFRVPLAGGEPEMLLPDGWLYDLESDGEDVYWADSGTYSGPAGQQVDDENGRVGRFGPDGGTVLLEGLPASPMGLALDAELLYRAEYGAAGAVIRMPKAGGTPETVAEVRAPRDVVVVPEGTYVTRDATDEISIVPPGSTELQCFASLPEGVRGHPAQIALSNEFVYVLKVVPGESVGSVVRAPRRTAE